MKRLFIPNTCDEHYFQMTTLTKLMLFIFMGITLNLGFGIWCFAQANNSTGVEKDTIITTSFFGIEPLPIQSSKVQTKLQNALPLLKKLNVGVIGVNSFLWENVEPDFAGNYQWMKLDPIFKLVHDNNFTLQINVISISSWGTMIDSLQTAPKPQHWKDFRNFIYNLIERYDGDGFADAVGINKKVISVINISSEIEIGGKTADHWAGTADEYNQMQQALFEETKKADSTVIVARGASNFGPLFDNYPNEDSVVTLLQKTFPRNWYSFFDSTVYLQPKYYDMFAFHFNSYHSSVSPAVEWLDNSMTTAGFRKLLYSEDTRSSLVNSDVLQAFYPDVNHNGTEDIIEILEDINHADYQKSKEIYYNAQASLLVKKLTLGLYSGLQSMFISSLDDWTDYGGITATSTFLKWRHAGLIDTRIAGNNMTNLYAKGARKPAYFSYQLFINKVLRAKRQVDSISFGKNIYAYHFQKDSLSTFVIWHEDIHNQTAKTDTVISLKDFISADSVKITKIITAIGDTIPVTAFYPTDKIPLSLTPSFLETTSYSNYLTVQRKHETPFDNAVVYPNPVSENMMVAVTTSHSTEINISIINILGQTLITHWQRIAEGTTNITINTRQLKTGCYFVNVMTSSGHNMNQKIIVSNNEE